MHPFNKIRTKIHIGLLVLLMAGSLAVLSGFSSRNFEIARHLDIFTTLFRELIVNYVDDVNPSEVIQTGIDEMLYSLDPYTTFIPESQIEDYRFMTTGQYGGIGALIHRRGDYSYISEPYEGFPAHKSGLLPGDRILEVNGRNAHALGEDGVRMLLQGQPGTQVEILIEREGEKEPLLKTLTREVVSINNIPYFGMLDDHSAYIKLNGFTQHASREVRDALNQLRRDHKVENVIIDLRGNGGGLLNEAVNITNLFVDKNELVVSTKGRLKERNTSHHTLNDPLDKQIPLVVLVDRASASASEIVAGAIQDLDRGVVLGQRTFGKGLVQNVVPLSYNTQLKVTVAKYYIPSGRCIQAIDYAQRNEDGSVKAIPDSLKVAFKTRSGRLVFDGGGIEPDFSVEPPQYGQITMMLVRQFLIFDFANQFYRKNPTIPPADMFRITDEIYDDFRAFLNTRDFDYTTESERLLDRVKQVAAEEKYYDSIATEFEQLWDRLLHNKDQDLITFRKEISQILKEEIVSRYYYQKGRVVASLKDDPEVEAALQLLSNKNQYNKLLSVNP
jgi:carboxyl-terminal processing protease